MASHSRGNPLQPADCLELSSSECEQLHTEYERFADDGGQSTQEGAPEGCGESEKTPDPDYCE